MRSPAALTRKRISPKIAAYRDAGFDHIYLHQVGPDQQGFMRFYERSLLPELESVGAASNRA